MSRKISISDYNGLFHQAEVSLQESWRELGLEGEALIKAAEKSKYAKGEKGAEAIYNFQKHYANEMVDQFLQEFNIEVEEVDKININIWDDYYDDGYIPEGKIQETYVYVEEAMDHQEQKKVLEFFLEDLKKMISGKTEVCLRFYDSKVVYPNLKEDKYHFSRWEIHIKNLNHTQREILVDYYENCPPLFNKKKLNVYSES